MALKITSIANPTIKRLVSLKDKKQRNIEKAFIIEGLHLVNEAYENNMLEAVFSCDENILKKYQNIDKYVVTKEIIEKASTTTTPQNIVGISRQLDNFDLSKLKNKEEFKIVILDEVNDPGNLGTIIRTSAALGYDLFA